VIADTNLGYGRLCFECQPNAQFPSLVIAASQCFNPSVLALWLAKNAGARQFCMTLQSSVIRDSRVAK
jgi:hypothetical protein